ncbi:MAG: ABC transporter substrate-binding protein [Candidatus Xenobia bacterium]
MLKKVGGIVLVLIVLAVPLFFVWRATHLEDLSLPVRQKQKMAAVAVIGTPDNLNFVLDDNTAAREADGVLFRGLVEYTDHWQLQPEFADHVPRLEHGEIAIHGPNEVVTYTLGSAGRWQDDQPVTADDFVFPFELAESLPPPHMGQWSHPINYQVQGTQTLSVRYDRLEFTDSMNLLPLPAHALRPLITRNLLAIRTVPFNQTPLSCGPFAINQNNGKGLLSMLPNPQWTLHKPGLSRLLFYFLPDASSRLDAVAKGRVDVLPDLTPDEVQALSKKPDLTVQATAMPTVWCLFFDTHDPQLKKSPIRRILAQAISRQACAEGAYGAWGKAAFSYLAPQHPDYVPAWPDVKPEPKLLKQQLEQAGFKNADLVVFALSDNPRGGEIARQIVDAWHALGIACHVIITRAELVGRYTNDQAPAAVVATLPGGPWVQPSTLFSADRAPSPANKYLGLNYARWNDAATQKLCDGMDKATDSDKLAADMKSLQNRLADQMPLVPLFNEMEFTAWRTTLQNVKPRGLGTTTWNAEEWQWKD